jgi:copper homeostasis protein
VSTKSLVEIACFDATHVPAISAAGANRIELCAEEHAGGITPSHGSIQYARQQTKLPVFVMIRPRAGGFIYSREETSIMLEDIKIAKELGANGIVCGALDERDKVDVKTMALLIEAARGFEITFHRAFDHVADPIKALDELIKLGVKRVLTSGQQNTAEQGIGLLKELVAHSAGRITILAGGGVNSGNIEALYAAGIREFHASAFAWKITDINETKIRFSGYTQSEMVCDEAKIHAMKNKLLHLE